MMATSLKLAICALRTRSAVSRNEQPSAKWISSTRSKLSASATLRHRVKAPNSLACFCQPSGKSRNR